MNNKQHCELRVWAAPLRFHVIMTQSEATDMQYAQREKGGDSLLNTSSKANTFFLISSHVHNIRHEKSAKNLSRRN